MAEWSATVAGKDYELRVLTFTIGFDGNTWVDVWFRYNLNRETTAQTTLQIKKDGEYISPRLQIVGRLVNDGIRVRPATLPKAAVPKETISLYQRGKGDSVKDMIVAICGGKSIGNEDIFVDSVDLNAVSHALREGTCVAMRNALSQDTRFSRMVDLLAARGVVVGGWIRTFASEKPINYVFVGDEAESTATLNSEEWSVSSSDDSVGGTFRVTRNFAEGEDPGEIAEKLLGASKTTVKKECTFPLAPTWVKFGEDGNTGMFASRVTTQLALNDPDDATGSQGQTNLELTDRSARSQRATEFGSVMLLGEISAPAKEGEMFVKVKPCTVRQSAFEAWTMPKESKELSVYWTAPGYFQANKTTIYVPLRTKDIVIFVVNEAGPPLAVGALGEGLGEKEKFIRMWSNVTFHGNVKVEGMLEVE